MKKSENLNHKGIIKSKFVTMLGVVAFGGGLLLSGVVSADASVSATASTNTPKASVSASVTATQQQHLQTIITKGDQEISRRLVKLSTLTSKINSSTKLTASNRTSLSDEVGNTNTGLTSLKTQLDADTTLTTAHTDAESIYTEYRVYAVVAPKVALIKVADDQQVEEAKFMTLAKNLQTRITAEQAAGKDVTTLQSDLNDLTAKVAAAEPISANIEATVINVEPTDYNSNHAVLAGDNTQLETAHQDLQAAATDAKNIISGLKNL
jgi:hypothetical protein